MTSKYACSGFYFCSARGCHRFYCQQRKGLARRLHRQLRLLRRLPLRKFRIPNCMQLWNPKVSKGRSESPLVASAEAKFLRNAANPYRKSIKAPPHNSAARLAMSFPPSAACKFLDLPPVNLRNLHLHLTKNPFSSRPPHLCGVTLIAVCHE